MSAMQLKFQKFKRSQSGNTGILFALASVPLMLSAGVAVDMVRANQAQTNLQATVDASALAGAAMATESDQVRKQETLAFFDENKPDIFELSVPIIDVGNGTVAVTVKATLDVSFSQIVGLSDFDVEAQATAVYQKGSPACILALDTSGSNALRLNSDALINAPDCNVHVNSNNGEALTANSNGDINAAKICVNGNWTVNSGSDLSPTPEHCPVISDPLAYLNPPSEAGGTCDYTNQVFDGSVALMPGVFCGKTEFNSGADITLAPGIYVFKDGELVVNSGSSVRGTNVMLFLTGNNNARINVNSNSHIDLSAPKTGAYAGIAIYQERETVADFSTLNSDSTSKIEGVVYLPSTPLHLNSNGIMLEKSKWTALVAKSFEVNSFSQIHVNADYEKSSVPLPLGLSNLNYNVRLIN